MPRVLAVPAALLAAASVAGCSTFTDNSSAARVDDQELSDDELDELIVAATPGATGDGPVEASADTARDLIGTWLLTHILEGEINAAGGAIAQTDSDDAVAQLESQFGAGWADATPERLRELQIEQTAAVNVWRALGADAPDDAELQAVYEQGIEASEIACTAHILVETEDDAREIVDALEDGADFAELAAQHSIDQGTAQNGGDLPCDTAITFSQTYVSEYVGAALSAEVGVPTPPVESQFGFHVILVRPFDDVIDEGVAELYNDVSARFRRAARAADVYVDPRYGRFDPSAGVVPLG